MIASHAANIGKWTVCGAMIAAGWLPNFAVVVTGATVEAVRILECGLEGERCPAVVSGVAMSADGQTIAAAGDDHTVRIWDAATGQLRLRLAGHSDWVRTVALSPDGQTLATGANDRTIGLWNASTGERLFASPELSNVVAAISFHPNGQQLAVVGFSNSLAIINTSSGQITQQLECPSDDVRAVAFSRDGQRMAVAGRNGQIRLWNVATGALERDIPSSRQRIRALGFSPDGTKLASAGEDVTIHVVDLTSGGRDVSFAARPAKIYAAVFLTNESLATAGSDNRIRVWDVASRAVTKELVGHTGSVAALACDASGTKLVSGSYDTTLRIWELEEDGPPPSVARLPGDAAR